MNSNIETLLDKLEQSFNNLDRALDVAKSRLSKRPELIAQIDQYKAIVIKQRDWAAKIPELVKENQLPELNRIVNIINGLSGMIREDATEVVIKLKGERQ